MKLLQRKQVCDTIVYRRLVLSHVLNRFWSKVTRPYSFSERAKTHGRGSNTYIRRDGERMLAGGKEKQ
jgi:hypothetical protein